MCEREMDGALFKTLLESGCRSLKANVRRLNDLNVFLIPDGDTGDNMLKTLYGGFLAIKDAADLSAFDENSVMIYGYCTEFLLQLTHAKTDIPAFSLESFKRRLAGMGDSIVAVQTGTIVKIHIHTLSPGAILQYAQTFGEFLTVKIENMTLQHHETALREKTEFERIAKRRKNAVVAVAKGDTEPSPSIS